jgi:hypothetical protein
VYSALLVEDFITGLRRNIEVNKPASTFIIGVLISLYEPTTKNLLGKTIRSVGAHHIIAYLEDRLYHDIEPIINNFVQPVEKAIDTIIDGSFITPNSKFYDIIQFGVTFLLLSLGFVIGKLIATRFGNERKENLFKQYKKFVTIILAAFVIASAIMLYPDQGDAPTNPREFDDEALKNFKVSKNRNKRAFAKAYELVVAKYPQLKKVPLYYTNNDLDDMGYDYDKRHNRNIMGIPKVASPSFTDDELVAGYIHELGHLLGMRPWSPFTESVINLLVMVVRSITESSYTKTVVGVGAHILDNFFRSVSFFNDEMFADVFTVPFGYGEATKSFLRKYFTYNHVTYPGDVESVIGKLKHEFISHSNNNKRIEYIERAERYYKQRMEELAQKTTDVIKKELNKGEASV